MPKFPPLKAKDLVKLAESTGFVHDRTKGSHLIFYRPSDKKTISIPSHQGQELGLGLTKALIKQMGLSAQKALEVLKR